MITGKSACCKFNGLGLDLLIDMPAGSISNPPKIWIAISLLLFQDNWRLYLQKHNSISRQLSSSLAPGKFQCTCGKTIEYIDRVVGGNNAQSTMLACSKCQKEHQITFYGFLSEIKGASIKQ